MQSIGGGFNYAQIQMMEMQMLMGSASSYQAGMTGGFGNFGMMQMQRSDQMYAGFSGFVGMVGFQGYAQQPPITDDPYGVAQSGQGVKSNLANSPEDLLAMQDILKGGGTHTHEEVVKTLKEKYGIMAEVGDITTTDKDGTRHTSKGIKFADGDYFVDGNGNGSLDTGDYKFDDAVKNLKDKYHLTDDNLKGMVDNMHQVAASGGTTYATYGNRYQGMAMFAGEQMTMGQSGRPSSPAYWSPMMMFEEAMEYAA